MENKSLTNKTIKGVGWNTLDKLLNYGISFIVSVVLARILSPDEYGLIGIILIFTGVFNTILDGGLQTALIRKNQVTDDEYCTVFYINIALSIIFTLLLISAAPYIAIYFNRVELTPLIRAMSSILIINALSLTQQTKLTRNIDFKTQTKITLISYTTSGIIGISLALLEYGVWALVAQQLTSRAFCTICLWLYNKWIPHLKFSFQSFRDLVGFSWYLLVARIIDSIWTQLYQAVVGKYYTPAALGQYTRANQYANLFSSSIGDVVLKVSLPVMSNIKDDNERLLRAYKKIIKSTMFVTFILMFGMIASAKSLILFLIGAKWIECIPMLQLICLNVMLYPLHMININILIVQGRSDVQLYIQILKNIIAIVPIAVGVYTNIYWMIIGSVVVGWLSFFINSYYSGIKLNYSSLAQLKDILPSLIYAISVAIPVYIISLLGDNCFILFPIQLFVGLNMVIIIGEISKNEEYLFIKKLSAKTISRLKNK